MAGLLIGALFLAGLEACLPNASATSSDPSTVPGLNISSMVTSWGISYKELLLLLHALLNPRCLFRVGRPSRRQLFVVACWLFLVLGVTSSLINGYPEDLPKVSRFLLVAYLAVALRDYLDKRPIVVPAAALVLGFALSIATNIYYSYSVPRGYLGSLPMLWGQNGPGGYAGLFIGLSYPLYLLLDREILRRLVLITIGLCVFLLVISFSKLGIIMGAAGLTVWMYAFVTSKQGTVRALRLTVVVALIVLAPVIAPSAVVNQARLIYDFKFADPFDDSDVSRLSYYAATAQVAVENPLGVSFAGIYPAFQGTAAGAEGRLPDDPFEENVREVNPHNSFLYYVAAHGMLGLIPTTMVFVTVLVAAFRTIERSTKQSALFPGSMVAVTCLVFTNTLPGFFSSFFVLGMILLIVEADERARSVPTNVDLALARRFRNSLNQPLAAASPVPAVRGVAGR